MKLGDPVRGVGSVVLIVIVFVSACTVPTTPPPSPNGTPSASPTTSSPSSGPSGSPTTPGAFAKITVPGNNSMVPSRINPSGTSNLKKGDSLWMVIRDREANYYPQLGPVPIGRGGEWTAPTVYVGKAEERGTQYTLLAVVAGGKAKTEFQNYVENRRTKGIRNLLDAKELDEVKLTRK